MANRAAHPRRRELQKTSGPGMRKAGERASSVPPSLAEMDEVLLSREELEAMLQRLAHHAQHVHARVKREANAFSHEPVSLDELGPLLASGDVFGAQIDYSYKSGQWLDTLIVTSAGIRVIRMQLSSSH